MARDQYMQGLDQPFEDNDLRVSLLTNRAAMNLLLGNNRKVVEDCTAAVTLKKDAVKAYWRATIALNRLQKYAEAIEWCDRGLVVQPTNKEFVQERVKAVAAQVRALPI
jgi:tetratricopeptide (TPR) repeat protein